jgi:uncharacterized protein YjbI with pentapeptide repeats
VVFNGPVSFDEAEISYFFVANGMFNAMSEVSFKGLKVARVADLNGAAFSGATDFSNGKISRLEAQGVRFSAKGVDFGHTKVDGEALLDKAIFSGQVTFVSAEVGELSAEGARFEAMALFGRMKASNVNLSKAVFSKGALFSLAEFGEFIAEGVQFNGPRQVDFRGTKLRRAVFSDGVFEGEADFTLAEIGAQFAADSARFKADATFYGLKTEAAALFRIVRGSCLRGIREL